jgi:Outer membrane protein beta-barrel domain
MSCSYRVVPTLGRVAFAVAALVLAGSASVLSAQTSSSADYHLLADPDASATLAPDASGEGASNTSNHSGVPSYSYPEKIGHLAAVFGGGFTTPAGSDQHDLTYGWNVDLGGGYKFNKKFSILGEYQFDSNKIPAKVLEQVGEPGGNIHIWSLTANPVWNYKTSGVWGGYVTGGGGFYRKTTTFTEPALITGYYCDYFYCYPYQYVGDVVVSQFSTNQAGMDIGGGFTFGNWSGGKFYAEARYNWIATPGRSTKIIPATFGFRW